jgi:hypothetical protein
MAGDVVTASGTRVFIGSAVTSAVDTIAEFEGISGWVEVGLVESVGEYGDQSNAVNFEALGDGRVRHSKGARDAGTLAIVCGHDPTDSGQAALIAAEATNNNYAFKVILPDGPAGYSDTIQYFRGMVMGKRLNVGNNENIIRKNFSVTINSEIFEDPASI